jgi:hypothetical protein
LINPRVCRIGLRLNLTCRVPRASALHSGYMGDQWITMRLCTVLTVEPVQSPLWVPIPIAVFFIWHGHSHGMAKKQLYSCGWGIYSGLSRVIWHSGKNFRPAKLQEALMVAPHLKGVKVHDCESELYPQSLTHNPAYKLCGGLHVWKNPNTCISNSSKLDVQFQGIAHAHAALPIITAYINTNWYKNSNFKPPIHDNGNIGVYGLQSPIMLKACNARAPPPKKKLQLLYRIFENYWWSFDQCRGVYWKRNALYINQLRKTTTRLPAQYTRLHLSMETQRTQNEVRNAMSPTRAAQGTVEVSFAQPNEVRRVTLWWHR